MQDNALSIHTQDNTVNQNARQKMTHVTLDAQLDDTIHMLTYVQDASNICSLLSLELIMMEIKKGVASKSYI